MSLNEDPVAIYRQRVERARIERDLLARRSRTLSQLRLAAFVALITFGVAAERSTSAIFAPAAAVAAVAFILLIARHRQVRSRQEWQHELVRLNEEGLHRLQREWELLPLRRPSRDISGHAYADDLDIHGRASLIRILGPVGSAVGAATLDDWLLQRAEPGMIAWRQQAVRELTPHIDLRQTFAIHARRSRAVDPRTVEKFLTWAEKPGWLRDRKLQHFLAWALPAATWALLLLHATAVIDTALWLIPIAATLVLYMTTGARSRVTFDEAFGREPMFRHYPDMLRAVTHARFTGTSLTALRDRLHDEGEPADQQLDRLQRIMHLADLRTSSLHVLVFVLSAWDIHVLRALEAWQRRAGPHVRDWLAALGEFEALSALATLAHDQPEWTYPVLDTARSSYDAVALGHPLLSDAARVVNDVQVGPAGTFLLVTGSNMSGKSTLLRAIGLNAVLAQAGAPVCARSLQLPPVDVCTSIRVQDSLARGVSYFMAELERLKVIVDAAHETAARGDAVLLFLLDEILHGTNTAERRIAARRVIRHLVDAGAIGAATTHDLELAEEPALAETAQLVHFQEFFTEESDGTTSLRFDYRLRTGLATSTNALELMKLVGLPAE